MKRVCVLAAAVAVGLVRADEEEMSSSTMTPAPIVCEIDADEVSPSRNTDTGINYAVGWYGDIDVYGTYVEGESSAILWPYAIDKCTALGPFDGVYGKFTCVNDNVVNYKRYGASDADCEGDAAIDQDYTNVEDLVSEDVNYVPPSVYPIKCDGSSDSGYVSIDFGLGQCNAGQHTYGTVGVCGLSRMPPTFVPAALSYLFCDGGGAKTEAFEFPSEVADSCSDDLYCADLTIGLECAEVFETSVAVYGKMIECTSEQKDDNVPSSDDSDSDDDSAITQSAFLSFALSAVAALAHFY